MEALIFTMQKQPVILNAIKCIIDRKMNKYLCRSCGGNSIMIFHLISGSKDQHKKDTKENLVVSE